MKEKILRISASTSEEEIRQRLEKIIGKFDASEGEREAVRTEFYKSVYPEVVQAKDLVTKGSTVEFRKALPIALGAIRIHFESREPSIFRKLLDRILG